MSQYLNRVPLSKAKGQYCYYCDSYMQDSNSTGRQYRYTKTKDHILSRKDGRVSHCDRPFDKDRMPLLTMNTRPCCADCNTFRVQLGNCVGVLMMLIIEGRRTDVDKRDAAIALDHWRGKNPPKPPHPKRKK